MIRLGVMRRVNLVGVTPGLWEYFSRHDRSPLITLSNDISKPTHRRTQSVVRLFRDARGFVGCWNGRHPAADAGEVRSMEQGVSSNVRRP